MIHNPSLREQCCCQTIGNLCDVTSGCSVCSHFPLKLHHLLVRASQQMNFSKPLVYFLSIYSSPLSSFLLLQNQSGFTEIRTLNCKITDVTYTPGHCDCYEYEYGYYTVIYKYNMHAHKSKEGERQGQGLGEALNPVPVP